MKFKYSKFIFELEQIPLCNVCNSNLIIHSGYKQITYIDNCSNENCLSKKGTLNKYKAFLPRDLCDIETKKYRNQLSKKRKNSIEYWTSRGFTNKESKIKVLEFQQFASKKVKNRFVPTRENYKSLGYSDEEIDQKLLTPNKKAFWIKKGLSNDETEKKIKEFQGKISKRRHSKYRLAIDQNDKIEINRYKSQNPVNTEYWLLRGFSEDEAKQKVSERQATFTLEKCIIKYGEKEGRNRWIERQKKWKKKVFSPKQWIGRGRSNISEKFISELQHLYPSSNSGKQEKFIYDKLFDRVYKYDFCLDKKIIEFNGDFWHGKPDKFTKDDINKCTCKTYEEIWIYDKQKNECAQKNGYQVLYIWESEYKQNPIDTINKCINFLEL